MPVRKKSRTDKLGEQAAAVDKERSGSKRVHNMGGALVGDLSPQRPKPPRGPNKKKRRPFGRKGLEAQKKKEKEKEIIEHKGKKFRIKD